MNTKQFLIIAAIIVVPALVLFSYSQSNNNDGRSVVVENTVSLPEAATTTASIATTTHNTVAASQPSSHAVTSPGLPRAGGSITSNSTSVTPQNTSSAASGHYYVFVAPDAYYKMQGGNVTFAGSHFYPGETVTIRQAGVVVGTILVDSTGKFSTGSFQIPYSNGTQRFTFIGDVSKISFPVDIMVDGSDPWLTLSTYYAGDNAPVTINGFGFGSGEVVNVWFNNHWVGSVTASAQGSFTLTTTVPESTQGRKTVTAEGAATKSKTVQTFSQAF
jgi:hypothetical protein